MAVRCVRCGISTVKPTWTDRGHLCPTCAADSLDAALTELEAALPKGWTLLIGQMVSGGWWATASEPLDPVSRSFSIISTSERGALYPTMAAALRALTAKLRGAR